MYKVIDVLIWWFWDLDHTYIHLSNQYIECVDLLFIVCGWGWGRGGTEGV